MDVKKFDRVAKAIGEDATRRRVLAGLFGATLVASLGCNAVSAKGKRSHRRRQHVQAQKGASQTGNSQNARRCQKGGWATLAPSEDPTTPFANQGACVAYGAQGGSIVDQTTTHVVATVAPFDGEYCDVTITLIDGVAGTPVAVVVNISTGSQFRPLFIPPTSVQDTGRLLQGMSMVSASAELYDSTFQPTGVFVPVDFPSSTCGG